MTRVALNGIFITAGLLLVLMSSFAAFIPGAPFQSPFSSFIGIVSQIIPNRSIRGPITIRTVCVVLICAASLVGSFTLYPLILRMLVLALVPISLLSLCERTQAEKKVQGQPKLRLFSLATWLYFHSAIIIVLFLTAISTSSFVSRIVFFSLSGIMLVVMTKGAMRMSQRALDEDKAEAEAVIWMIKTQPSHDLAMFQKAVEIAQNSADLRSTLLKDILPVLEILITSVQGDREQDLADKDKIYITLLRFLVDFEPCKASFWRNEAAVKEPVLSDGLVEKLRSLRKGCSGHSSPHVPGCTKAEAEFILGKVGEAYSVQKESTWVESHVV
jgi:hypothetical protein